MHPAWARNPRSPQPDAAIHGWSVLSGLVLNWWDRRPSRLYHHFRDGGGRSSRRARRAGRLPPRNRRSAAAADGYDPNRARAPPTDGYLRAPTAWTPGLYRRRPPVSPAASSTARRTPTNLVGEAAVAFLATDQQPWHVIRQPRSAGTTPVRCRNDQRLPPCRLAQGWLDHLWDATPPLRERVRIDTPNGYRRLNTSGALVELGNEVPAATAGLLQV